MTKQLNKKGTSLVELIAVIVIMGIIAGIAIPTTIAVINRQKKNAATKSADNVFASAKNVLLEASANPGSALIVTGATATADNGVIKDGNDYTITEQGLVALGELDKKVSDSGTVTFKLTSVGTSETGTNTYTITEDAWTINGYNVYYDENSKSFKTGTDSGNSGQTTDAPAVSQ